MPPVLSGAVPSSIEGGWRIDHPDSYRAQRTFDSPHAHDGMTIETYFDNRFSLLPPGEGIELTAESWQWIRARHSAALPERDVALRVPAALASYGMRKLANAFGRPMPVSTMRELVRNGVCGNPRALKPDGKAYDIGGDIVRRLQESVASGHALGSCCLLPARVMIEGAESESDACSADACPPEPLAGDDSPTQPASHATPEQLAPTAPAATRPRRTRSAPTSPAPTGRTRPRDRNSDRVDLGAWRSHVKK